MKLNTTNHQIRNYVWNHVWSQARDQITVLLRAKPLDQGLYPTIDQLKNHIKDRARET